MKPVYERNLCGVWTRLFCFFQAEDGIRYHCVTGVQTGALPILAGGGPVAAPAGRLLRAGAGGRPEQRRFLARLLSTSSPGIDQTFAVSPGAPAPPPTTELGRPSRRAEG